MSEKRMQYSFSAPIEKHEMLLGILGGEVDNLSFSPVRERPPFSERFRPPQEWESSKAVIAFMRKHAERPVHLQEATEALKNEHSEGAVRGAMQHLARQGALRRVRHGLYELVK